MIVDNIYVTRLIRDNGRVVRVETNQGAIDVPRGGAVILALGTIENTRMVLNTVPEKPLVGRNLMAHLRSNLTFRVPHSSFSSLNLTKELSVSALFVKGIHTRSNGGKGHFHVQITASGVGQLGMNSEAELFKRSPNRRARPVPGSQRQMDRGHLARHRRDDRRQAFGRSAESDKAGCARRQRRAAAVVRLETNPKDASDPRGNEDNILWDVVDAACDEIASMFAGASPVQYLSTPNDPATQCGSRTRRAPGSGATGSARPTTRAAPCGWASNPPLRSPMMAGASGKSTILSVMGPAVLPTMGSPNPML